MDADDYWQQGYDFILLATTSSVTTTLAFLVIGILLLCSAMISGSEVAYFSLGIQDIRELRKSDRQEDRFVIDLIDRPGILLATILITNNFINIAIIIISSFALGEVIGHSAMPGWLTFMIEVVLVTFFLVLFGEISPKIYANLNNLRLARFMGRPLLVLRRIFYIFSRVLVRSTSYIEKRLAKRTQENYTSLDEISQAIDLTVKDKQVTTTEENMLKGIIHLSNTTVKQVMCPRVNVVALDSELSFGEVLDIVRTENHSRIPVYENNIDEIRGILYVKDLLAFLDKDDEKFRWTSLMKPAIFVSEHNRIDDVLEKFKQERVHLAIVADEYGGTAGIITLEDILEEVIGDIKDEFDEEEEIKYEQLSDNTYQFEGATLLNDICRILNLDITTFDAIKGDADSIAGLVLQLCHEIPKTGTVIEEPPFIFEVKEAEERRIVEIVLTVMPEIEE